jgi:hypothetical protein
MKQHLMNAGEGPEVLDARTTALAHNGAARDILPCGLEADFKEAAT